MSRCFRLSARVAIKSTRAENSEHHGFPFFSPPCSTLLVLCQLATPSSVQPFECFESNGNLVLREAVRDYITGANSEVGRGVRAGYGSSIGNWCVDRVTSVSLVFVNQPSFNENLTNWNTSSGTITSSMFALALIFNGLLSSMDTSRVTDAGGMFPLHAGSTSLAQFDMSNCVNFNFMFNSCLDFNHPLPWTLRPQSSW